MLENMTLGASQAPASAPLQAGDQLILIAGQSNAIVFNNTGPANYSQSERVLIAVDVNGDGVPDVWQPLHPGVNSGGPNTPTAWGPEVQIAKDWLAANDFGTLYIGKVAKGSTSLAQESGIDWSPHSHGELFDQATGVANWMLAQTGHAKLDALFWVQGEDDALVQSEAQAYQANLHEFLGAARASWMHDASGYVGISRISDSAALPYNQDVRVAQWAEDQVDLHMESFKTIGLGYQADGIHLDAGGTNALGDGLFNGWYF